MEEKKKNGGVRAGAGRPTKVDELKANAIFINALKVLYKQDTDDDNKIALSFDESVKMMGKQVGGIRVKPTQLIKEKQPINQERFTTALEAIKSGKFDKEKLSSDFMLTTTQKLTLEKL